MTRGQKLITSEKIFVKNRKRKLQAKCKMIILTTESTDNE